jgi:hypothetical protein
MPHYSQNQDYPEFIFSLRIHHNLLRRLPPAINLHFIFKIIITQPLAENHFFPKHPSDQPSNYLVYDDGGFHSILNQSLIFQSFNPCIVLYRVLLQLPQLQRLYYHFKRYLLRIYSIHLNSMASCFLFLHFFSFLLFQTLLNLRPFFVQTNTHRHLRNFFLVRFCYLFSINYLSRTSDDQSESSENSNPEWLYGYDCVHLDFYLNFVDHLKNYFQQFDLTIKYLIYLSSFLLGQSPLLLKFN